MKEKSLKKNAIFSILKSFMGIIFPIVTFPYASRILLSEGIGKVNFINAIVDYFVLIASLGIQGHGIRELAKVKNDIKQFTKTAKELLTINIISTITAYTLLFLALFFSKKLIQYKHLILICSIKILLTTFGIEWLYKASEDFVYITKRTIFFQLVSIIYLFVFVHKPSDIYHYMFFTILSSVGSNLCNIFYSRKKILYSLKVKLELKPHLKPIFILFGTTIAASVFTLLDSTMLGFMKTDSDVGYYSAATKINRMAITILAAINAVIAPRMSYYLENNKNKYNELLMTASNIFQALALPMVAGMIILAEPLTFIFCGNNYVSSVLPMKIMSPIIFFVIMGSLLSDQILIPHRKDFHTLISVIIGSIINFILNLIFIPKYSISGAAFASVTSEGIILIIKSLFSKKLENNFYRQFSLIWQYLLATFIMVLLLIVEIKFLNTGVINLFIEIITGALTYCLVLILFKNEYLLKFLKVFFSKIKKNKK